VVAKIVPAKGRQKPEKRLTPKQLADQTVAAARERPIVLDEADYREWLDHTVLARMHRGEEALDKVRDTLKEMGKGSPDSREPSRLALEELDRAVVAFQYSALKFNLMYRPAIDGAEAANVVLWPRGGRR
jgi:hypothetical protein